MGPLAILEVLVVAKGIQGTNGQLMQVHATGQKVAGSAAKAAAAVSGVGAAGGRAGAGMTAAAKGADGAGRSFGKAGFGMSTSIGKLRMFGPLGAIAGASLVSMGVDFEDSMQKIVALVGVSQKQVDQWSKELMVLGPQLGKSPQELAEALYFLTSSGLSGTQAMEALTISAKASSAGLGDMTKIADAVSSAMNAYGPATMNAAKATDILVATAKAGKAEPEELAAAMGRVLPIASQLGVSFEDVGGAVAAMSLKGLNAAESVTAVRQMLQAVMKPTQSAKKVMEEYGISADNVRASLKEKGLLATLQDLRGKFKGNTEDLSRLFEGVEGFNGVLSLTAGGGKKAAAVFADVARHTGLTQEAFDSSKTAGFRFRQALAALQAAGIAVAGVMASLIGFFADNRTALTALMAVVAGAVAAWAAWKVGMMIATAANGGFIASLHAMKIAILTNPIVAAIAAVVALGAALYILYQRSETVRNAVNAVWAAIRTAAAPVIAWLSTAIPAAWDWILQATQDAWPTIRTILQTTWAVIKAIVTTAAPVIANNVRTAWNVIRTVTQAVWPAIRTIVSVAVSSIRATIATIRTVIAIVTGAWNAVRSATSAAWGAIRAVVSSAIGQVRAVVATLRAIVGIVTGVWNSVRAATVAGWNAVRAAITGAITAAIGAVRGLVGQFVGIGGQIISGLVSGIMGRAGAVASAAAGVVKGAIGAAKSALGIKSPSKVFQQIGRFTGEGFVRGLTGSKTQISSTMESLVSTIKRIMSTVGGDVSDLRKKIGDLRIRISGTEDAKAKIKLIRDLNRATRELATLTPFAGGKSPLTGLLTMAQSDNRKLQALAKDRERVAEKLKAAMDNLDSVLKARDDIVSGVSSGITGGGDITGFFTDVLGAEGEKIGSVTSGQTIIAALTAQVAAAKQMQTNLAALAAAGLNSGAIQQIANAGLEVGGATAAALVAEGGASIAAINSLQAQLTTAAQGIGNTTGDALYKVGIQAAVGLVEGLKSQESVIAKQMEKIAKAMIRAIKKALRIKSPSQEFIGLGAMVAKGFEVGIASGQSGVEGAIVQMGVPKPPPPRFTAGPGGGTAVAGGHGGDASALVASTDRLSAALERLLQTRHMDAVDALADHMGQRLGDDAVRRGQTAGDPNRTAIVR